MNQHPLASIIVRADRITVGTLVFIESVREWHYVLRITGNDQSLRFCIKEPSVFRDDGQYVVFSRDSLVRVEARQCNI